MDTCMYEAKILLKEVEHFLGAISIEVNGSHERERSNLLARVVEFKEKHNNCQLKKGCHVVTEPPDIPPSLPERCHGSRSGKGICAPPRKRRDQMAKCNSSPLLSDANTPPALPERRLHMAKIAPQAIPVAFDQSEDIYEVVDVATALKRHTSPLSKCTESNSDATSITTIACADVPEHTYSRQDEDLYEAPITMIKKQVIETDYPKDQKSKGRENSAPHTEAAAAAEEMDVIYNDVYVDTEITLQQESNQHQTCNSLSGGPLCDDATYIDMGQSQKPKPKSTDEVYVVMEATNGHLDDIQMESTQNNHDSFATEDEHSDARKLRRKTLSDVGKKLKKRWTRQHAPVSSVQLDSITDPDILGKLMRKKDKKIGTKWMEQTVIVKSNMIFISGKDSPGDISEYFTLSDAVIEPEKGSKQKHVFHIKRHNGKTILFAAQTEDEMQEWIAKLSKAASCSLQATETSPSLDESLTAKVDELIVTDMDNSTDEQNLTSPKPLLKSERRSESEVEDIPEKENLTEKVNEELSLTNLRTSEQCQSDPRGKNFEMHYVHPVQEPQHKLSDKDCDALHIAQTQSSGDTVNENNDELVYRAVKSYQATDDDELSFEIGDLILIETVNDDKWWFGTLQHKTTQQFTGDTGFIPNDYIVSLSSQN